MPEYAQWVILATVLALLIYTGYAVYSYRRFEGVVPRIILYGYLVFLCVFLFLNIQYTSPGAPPKNLNLLQSYIHFDVEGTIPNTLSGVLLALTSLLALVLIPSSASHHRGQPERLLWLFIGVMFGIAAYDEWFSPAEVHGQDITLIIYGLCGLSSVLMLVYLYWQYPRYRWYYGMMVLSLVAIAVGGILLDRRWIPFLPVEDDPGMFEEMLESLGIITILVVLLTFVHQQLSLNLRRILQGFMVVMLLAVITSIPREARLQPALEYWTDDTLCPTEVVFGDGILSLVAYTCPPAFLQPGMTYEASLYFRSEQPASENYSFSAHLVSLPDLQSVGQIDTETVGGGTLTGAWLPGTIYRQRVLIDIPVDIETPAAYALLVRLWASEVKTWDTTNRENWQNVTTGLPVTLSPYPVVQNDTLRLLQMPVMPTEPVAVLSGDTLYFENGIDLVVEEQGTVVLSEMLSFRQQWSASRDVAQNWSQILHLRHSGTGEITILDRSPFSGRLPADTWYAGFRASEQVAIDLPNELASGRYELLTGLYHPQTGERASLQDAPNNLRVIAVFDVIP